MAFFVQHETWAPKDPHINPDTLLPTFTQPTTMEDSSLHVSERNTPFDGRNDSIPSSPESDYLLLSPEALSGSFTSVRPLSEEIVLDSDQEPTIPHVRPIADLELVSLVPVIEKLESALVVQDDEYRLVGEIMESEWDSFRAFARRVSKLTLSDADGNNPRIADTTFFRLAQQQTSAEVLFPSLESLTISGKKSTMFYLPLLFSPSLTSITINNVTDVSRPAITSFLMMIGRRAEALHHLELDSLELSFSMITAILECNSLRTLTIANATGLLQLNLSELLRALRHLSVFKIEAKTAQYIAPPSTLDLRIQQPSIGRSLNVLHVAGTYAFIDAMVYQAVCICRAVEELKIDNIGSGDSIRYSLDLLRTYDRQGMKAPDPARRFTSPLIFFLRHELVQWGCSLQSLSLLLEPVSLNAAATKAFFIALRQLPLLLNLELSGIRFLNLDDNLRQSGESCWRKSIKTLRFPILSSSDSVLGLGGSITTNTLTDFVNGCPKLQTLQVLVRREDTASESWRLTSSTLPPSRLQHLSVGTPYDETIDTTSLAAIAVKFCVNFPELDMIETHQGFSQDLWEGVKTLMKLCRAGGVIERQRYDGSTI